MKAKVLADKPGHISVKHNYSMEINITLSVKSFCMPNESLLD